LCLDGKDQLLGVKEVGFAPGNVEKACELFGRLGELSGSHRLFAFQILPLC
jgi:hypothetical protein